MAKTTPCEDGTDKILFEFVLTDRPDKAWMDALLRAVAGRAQIHVYEDARSSE
jgi:hypothetical protein